MADLGTMTSAARTPPTAPRPDLGGRTLRRPGGLGGRAVVGGFLVAAAAVGIFAAYARATGGPSTSYVVARADLPVGKRLEAVDVGLAPMALPDELRARAFDDPGVLVGTTLLAPLAKDELVQASHVVRAGGDAGTTEVSLPLDASRGVGGRLKPGERVDVLSTFGTGADAYTRVMARRALVVRSEVGPGALGEGNTLVVTLAVATPVEALAVSHAAYAGQVTLVRGGDTASPGPEVYRPDPAEARARPGG